MLDDSLMKMLTHFAGVVKKANSVVLGIRKGTVNKVDNIIMLLVRQQVVHCVQF